MSEGRRSDILLNKIEALLIFDPLITLWGHFKAPYFKMLNDARVASACLYVRTCQRVRNSKNIATIRDFHLPSSFFCLSTRLVTMQLHILYLQILCYFKAETATTCCVKVMNLGLKLLEIRLFVSGGSRVEAVAEAVVMEAACTKSMESTASL